VTLPRSDKYASRESRVVLVLRDEAVVLDPLPRRLALGQQATLSGHIAGAAESPRVLISPVDGQLSAPEQAPGKAFRAELRCGDRPGWIRIEISGTVAGARRSLANFPVACGTELATSVPVAAPDWPSDVAQQERKVLENINAERTAGGIPALAWDDVVAGVARGISQALGDEERRDSATSASAVVAGLQKAGVPSPLVFANPGQGRNVAEAQQLLLESPVHRANMMNPETNHAGVGVSTVTQKSGATTTYLAELFVKVLPPVDLDAVRQQLLAAIAERRAEGKVAAISVDSALHEVAQKYAQEMAAAKGTLPEQRDTQMLDSLKKTYKGVNMLAGASAAPLEFANQRKVLANGKALGVGLAQGDHPTVGRNAFYVVILVGEPHEAAKPAKPAAKPPAKATPGK